VRLVPANWISKIVNEIVAHFSEATLIIGTYELNPAVSDLRQTGYTVSHQSQEYFGAKDKVF
jgi:hypothetical protein